MPCSGGEGCRGNPSPSRSSGHHRIGRRSLRGRRQRWGRGFPSLNLIRSLYGHSPEMSTGLGLESSGNFPYPVRMAEITFTSRLEIRLTEEDKGLFQRAADQDGRPLSNWI